MPKAENPVSHDKPCTLCGTPRPVLVRCRIDESGKWNFVCPGKCWTSVSGGVEDAKGHEARYPYYRYGGMWKNKHADGPVSAKKPKRVKEKQKRREAERQQEGEEAERSSSSSGQEEDAMDATATTGAE